MMRYSEEASALIEKYLKTEKQKSFQYDFFVDESKYEKREDIKFGQELSVHIFLGKRFPSKIFSP